MSRSPFRFEKLAIWQRSMDLWIRLHSATEEFPKSELYGLTSQIRRAACSVPANIAEGDGKGTNPSFAAHVRHSRGSLYELQTLVEGARRLGYIPEADASILSCEMDEISKMIDAFLIRLGDLVIRESMPVYGSVPLPSTTSY